MPYIQRPEDCEPRVKAWREIFRAIHGYALTYGLDHDTTEAYLKTCRAAREMMANLRGLTLEEFDAEITVGANLKNSGN